VLVANYNNPNHFYNIVLGIEQLPKPLQPLPQMKQLTVVLFALFSFSVTYAQNKTSVFRNPDSKYYSATDFAKIDSLNTWSYVLVDKNAGSTGPVKPIGELIFQRAKQVNGVTPNFTFQVYDIKDSAYCFKKSRQVRTASSCAPPNVAGDIIIINDFIFLNTNICLQCKIGEKGADFCRPLINKVFQFVDISQVQSLHDVVKQFPIHGQIVELPR
jgi:hypothetical protein